MRGIGKEPPSSILADSLHGGSCLTLRKGRNMLSELFQNVSLFRLLHQIDKDLAEACRQAGCPFCQGPLHMAPYLRKPRGGPPNIPEQYQVRLSLCCSRENCRRRVLPPSCLFMGRKVYWGAVILIITTLRQRKPQEPSINMLERKFDVPRNTIVRWIHYFRDIFPGSAPWQRLRGQVSPQVKNHDLPGSLVEYFLSYHPTSAGGLINCLRFLASGHVA